MKVRILSLCATAYFILSGFSTIDTVALPTKFNSNLMVKSVVDDNVTMSISNNTPFTIGIVFSSSTTTGGYGATIPSWGSADVVLPSGICDRVSFASYGGPVTVMINGGPFTGTVLSNKPVPPIDVNSNIVFTAVMFK